MRNVNRGRTAGALKRATPQMKAQYMNQYMELRATIQNAQYEPKPACTTCGKSIGTRPVWIPRTDTRCYNCIYESQQAKV